MDRLPSTSSTGSKRGKGFTLIEVLIIIAILAILAAIAVPNFLEAQIRARVARVHSDMRSIATAVEAYKTDYGVYMPSFADSFPRSVLRLDPPAVSREWWDFVWPLYPDNLELMGDFIMSQLTTPTAYMKEIPESPFLQGAGPSSKGSGETEQRETRLRTYWWERFTHQKVFAGRFETYSVYGFKWAIYSPGPSAEFDIGALAQAIQGRWTDLDRKYFWGPYDPSNGSVSRGSIYRTNKGIYATNPDPARFAPFGGG